MLCDAVWRWWQCTPNVQYLVVYSVGVPRISYSYWYVSMLCVCLSCSPACGAVWCCSDRERCGTGKRCQSAGRQFPGTGQRHPQGQRRQCQVASRAEFCFLFLLFSLFILYFFSFLALCSMVCSFVCFFVFLIFSAVVLALALLIGCCCCRCCCCGGVVVIVVVFFYVSFWSTSAATATERVDSHRSYFISIAPLAARGTGRYFAPFYFRSFCFVSSFFVVLLSRLRHVL